jgi:hypothetical protein
MAAAVAVGLAIAAVIAAFVAVDGRGTPSWDAHAATSAAKASRRARCRPEQNLADASTWPRSVRPASSRQALPTRANPPSGRCLALSCGADRPPSSRPAALVRGGPSADGDYAATIAGRRIEIWAAKERGSACRCGGRRAAPFSPTTAASSQRPNAASSSAPGSRAAPVELPTRRGAPPGVRRRRAARVAITAPGRIWL